MADDFIRLPADGSGKRVDAESLTVSAQTVYRERDQIAGKAALEIADVKNSDPDAAHYGLVVRLIPGTGAIHLGKSVDSAVGASDVGVAALFERKDVLATLTPADGDYVRARVDSVGAQWVRDAGLAALISAGALAVRDEDLLDLLDTVIDSGKVQTADADVLAALEAVTVAGRLQTDVAGSVTVSGAVTVSSGSVAVTAVIPGTTATALGKAVDSAVGATDTGVAALFERKDVLTTLVPADGDYVRARTDSVGAQWTRDAGLDGIISGGELQSHDADVLAALENVTAADELRVTDGDLTTAFLAVSDGSQLQVDVIAPLPAGTNNIGDVDVLSLPALPSGSNTIGNVGVTGTVAHDAVDTANPVKAGARAVSMGADPTAVAAADLTHLIANVHGLLHMIAGHPNVQTLRITSTQAETNLKLITVGTGNKIMITKISALLGHNSTADASIRIGLAQTNTPTGAGVVLTHPNVAPGSGVIEGSGAGIVGRGDDGDDLIGTWATPNGTWDILIVYYVVPV